MTLLTERLPAHPRRLPVFTVLLGILAGWILLGLGGSGFGKMLALMGGVLPVGQEGDGWLSVLLWRMVRTFFEVSMALLLGMSFALAVSIAIGGLPSWLRVGVSWLGRAFGGLPPMAWALGMLFVFVQWWQLPVESMFPSRPGVEQDTWMMKSGRFLWKTLAPAVVLALPVFVLTLRACLLRIGVLWAQPLVSGLRAKGCSWTHIQFEHLPPRLWPHVVRMAWPMTLLALAFSIPVEEVFMLKGWGGFVAGAMRAKDVNSLAAAVYAGSVMLALWFGVYALLERPLAASGRLSPLRLAPSTWATGAGVLLALVLMVMSRAADENSVLPAKMLELWKHEVALAGRLAALGALITVVGLLSRWLLPALLALAIVLPVKLELWMLLGFALALPEWLRARGELRKLQASDYALASKMMGGWAPRYLAEHALRILWPGLAAGFFRMTAAALLWMCVLTYFGIGVAKGKKVSSWGAMAHESSGMVLDAPWTSLAPLICTGLWCLCFHWIARGFGVGSLPAVDVRGWWLWLIEWPKRFFSK